MNLNLPPMTSARLVVCLVVAGWIQSDRHVHAAIILDDFLTDSVSGLFVVNAQGGGATQTGSLTSDSVVGGTRAYSAQAFGGGPMLRSSTVFRESPQPSDTGPIGISHSNDASIRSILSFTYDAGGAGLSLDLSKEDELQLLLRVDLTDDGPEGTMVIFELFDSSNGHHMHPVVFGANNAARVLDVRAPLADFTAAGVDLADVHTMILTYQAADDEDARFHLLRAVPEPGSSTLVMLILFPLTATVARRWIPLDAGTV